MTDARPPVEMPSELATPLTTAIHCDPREP